MQTSLTSTEWKDPRVGRRFERLFVGAAFVLLAVAVKLSSPVAILENERVPASLASEPLVSTSDVLARKNIGSGARAERPLGILPVQQFRAKALVR